MTYSQTGSAKRTNLVIIIIVCALLAAAVMLLPKGFNDDLSKIGQGTAVVVLTNDKNTVGGMELMVVLNDVRDDYEGKVEFLVVDVNTPQGRTFMQQQSVGAVALVLFGADGTRQGLLRGTVEEKELRSALEGVLNR